MSTGYWAVDVNTAEVSSFADELKKADASSGDFGADYTDICRKLNITPCSFVSFDASSFSCKISNCEIDLPSWRAAMIACGLVNSPVKCVAVYNCSLRRQYVSDLITMLDKRIFIDAVKLDSIDWGSDAADAHSILSALLSTTASVSYISLRYNSLGDDFIAASAGPLSQNLFLRYLNLSNNAISDDGLQSLISGALRLSISLHKISLRSNPAIGGANLTSLLDLIDGNVSSPEEETAFKSITKAATDKNKQIKETNKKRKKNNESEYAEIEVPDRIIKVGKTDLQLANKTIREIDLSWCDVAVENITMLSEHLVQRKEQLELPFRVVHRNDSVSEGDQSESAVYVGFSLRV